MGRLIFVNRFHWPEEPATSQLLTDLAEGLAADGRAVTVVTSRRAGLPRRDLHGGVTIARIGMTRLDGRSLFGRSWDFLTFSLASLTWLAGHARAGDTVVFLTDPPLLGALATPLLGLRGAGVVHWVQDIYPEIAIALSGQRWLGALRPLRNASWRRARRCVVLGPDMAEVLRRQGVPAERIAVIPNWAPAGVAPAADADVHRLRAELGLAGRFVALYSGNLGRVHDLMPLIDAATRLRDEADIVFLFVGRGGQRAALEAAVRDRGLAHVRFLPPQPRAALAAALGIGDVHFVTLLASCRGLVFPSKLYGIAAVGRPVIAVTPADSDLARTVVDAGLGRSYERGDVAGIADGLRALARDPTLAARHAAAAADFAHRHSFANALDAWRQVLAPVQAALADDRPPNQR